MKTFLNLYGCRWNAVSSGWTCEWKNPDNAFIVVANWMRNHSTISFLGLWEQIHNPHFKPIEFDRFKAESGDNAFTLTPQQWIKAPDDFCLSFGA